MAELLLTPFMATQSIQYDGTNAETVKAFWPALNQETMEVQTASGIQVLDVGNYLCKNRLNEASVISQAEYTILMEEHYALES